MLKKETMDLLQIYRGIAAIMVVIFHSWGDLPFYFNEKFNKVVLITSMGKFGVDFFFVLSGFIISYSYFNKPVQIKDYLKNRILRIYLPYLPIAIGLLLLYFIFPSISNSDREINIFATLTLFPVGESTLLPAWTLMHEMLFYVVFLISFFNVKLFKPIIIFWIVLIFCFYNFNLLTENREINYFINTVFSPYNIEFILGFFCFLIVKNNFFIKNSLVYAIVFLIVFVIIHCFNIVFFYFDKNLLFAFSSMFFIIYAYNNRYKKIKNSNLFMKFGSSSYSIYLIHLPIISVFFRIIPEYNVYLTFSITLFIIFLFSLVYSYFFEFKFLYMLKKKIN
jgi:exopolysaccharide production protein ExoZ